MTADPLLSRATDADMKDALDFVTDCRSAQQSFALAAECIEIVRLLPKTLDAVQAELSEIGNVAVIHSMSHNESHWARVVRLVAAGSEEIDALRRLLPEGESE